VPGTYEHDGRYGAYRRGKHMGKTSPLSKGLVKVKGLVKALAKRGLLHLAGTGGQDYPIWGDISDWRTCVDFLRGRSA